MHDTATPGSGTTALTDRDREILEFEHTWWKHPGAKDSAIRHRFDLSPTVYYAVLNRLIDQPAALVHDPLLVKRLLRLRDARRRHRSAVHRSLSL